MLALACDVTDRSQVETLARDVTAQWGSIDVLVNDAGVIQLPYSASKFALTGLSEGLRAELARENVLVTTVCPGLMRTGSPRNAQFKGQHRAEYAWFSIADATPVLTTSAKSAARRIVDACRDGDAELTFPLLTTLAVGFHGLFPGVTADILGQVNRALPDAGGAGTGRVRGAESQSKLSPAPLTALGDRAAARNNELG